VLQNYWMDHFQSMLASCLQSGKRTFARKKTGSFR
jgi:hypothetical protein